MWCSDDSDNEFDDFAALDLAMPKNIDARWHCDIGDARVDDGDNNVLETYGDYDGDRTLVRRGLRADKYVATFKFKYGSNALPGFLVRWLDPGNWLGVMIHTGGVTRPYLQQRKDDAPVNVLASGSTLSLTPGNWYTAKVVVDDDPNNAALQQLGWDGRLARR